MSHDYESAVWAELHHHMTDGLSRLLSSLAEVFERLQAIEYDAPWERVGCR